MPKQVGTARPETVGAISSCCCAGGGCCAAASSEVGVEVRDRALGEFIMDGRCGGVCGTGSCAGGADTRLVWGGGNGSGGA